MFSCGYEAGVNVKSWWLVPAGSVTACEKLMFPGITVPLSVPDTLALVGFESSAVTVSAAELKFELTLVCTCGSLTLTAPLFVIQASRQTPSLRSGAINCQ